MPLPMPRWSMTDSLGNAVLDGEHQRLFELLHGLEGSLYNERDMPVTEVNALVAELHSHVIDHFHHEESLMAGLMGMPEAERLEHHRDHEHWKRRIVEHLAPLEAARTDLERRAHLARILLILKAFWEQHFTTHDKKIADYLKP